MFSMSELSSTPLFLKREITRHKGNGLLYIVVQTPHTCVNNGARSYEIKPLGHRAIVASFIREQTDMELHWEKIESSLYHPPALEDVIDFLIRGDVLNFINSEDKLYVLASGKENGAWLIHGRRVVNGIANEKEISFDRLALLELCTVNTLQTSPIPPTPAKYEHGQVLKHVKSGERYTIAILPNKGVLENTREAAYSFMMPDGRLCHRAQAEVEDLNRFVPCHWRNGIYGC
jgi:hypothetical protein